MLRNLNQSAAGKRILGTPNVGILSATIAAETATGDNGPGLLYDESLLAGNIGKQLRCRITAWPSSGSLFVYENGSVDFSGAPDGSYTIGYAVDADAAQVATDSATVLVGAVNASAAAGTGSATGAGTGGAASGGAAGSANASAGTGTSTGSGTGGAASGTTAGSSNAAAAAGAGTSAGSGSGGAAWGSGAGLDDALSIYTLTAAQRLYRVSKHTMSLPPKDPAEIITIEFDFADLATAVINPQVSIAPVLGADDPSAATMLSGSPSLSGTEVRQRVIAGIDGTSYELRCIADTMDGSRYVIPGLLPVQHAKPQ